MFGWWSTRGVAIFEKYFQSPVSTMFGFAKLPILVQRKRKSASQRHQRRPLYAPRMIGERGRSAVEHRTNFVSRFDVVRRALLPVARRAKVPGVQRKTPS
jgi:hypothetical protein